MIRQLIQRFQQYGSVSDLPRSGSNNVSILHWKIGAAELCAKWVSVVHVQPLMCVDAGLGLGIIIQFHFSIGIGQVKLRECLATHESGEQILCFG